MSAARRVVKRDVPFRSEAEIRALVAQFEQGRWPYERWTHRAHLAVAVTYLQELPFEDALERVRRNIQQYNQTCGDPAGYHETITVFFMRLLRRSLDHRATGQPAVDFINELPQRYNLQTLLTYYSPGRLWSAAARARWVEPDLQPLAH